MLYKIKRKSERKKVAWNDRVYDLFCNVVLFLLVLIVFYPVYFVVIASFTDPSYVNSGKMLWYPVKFNIEGYKMVFQDIKVWKSYANTIFYTVCGTTLGTVVMVMAGYALSRKDLPGRKMIMKFLLFTMYFGGGIIPLYVVVRELHLVNTRAIIVILGSVSVYNIIVVRSFMQNNIPDELFDAATIDGCGQFMFFTKIVVPLSKAVIAVIVMYTAVGYWNSYFNAMIFLADSDKQPLQLYLRELLLMSSGSAANAEKELALQDPQLAMYLKQLAMVIKYSIIVVSTAPIICVYPFIQKYFVKGVMIGSIKG